MLDTTIRFLKLQISQHFPFFVILTVSHVDLLYAGGGGGGCCENVLQGPDVQLRQRGQVFLFRLALAPVIGGPFQALTTAGVFTAQVLLEVFSKGIVSVQSGKHGLVFLILVFVKAKAFRHGAGEVPVAKRRAAVWTRAAERKHIS